MSAPNGNGQHLVAPPPVNHGELTVQVWPAYLGLAESADGVQFTENVGNPDYDRGQIVWETRKDKSIYGHARVYAPKGVYTHFVFCGGPTENVWDVKQLEHPIVFDRPGYVDVDPIQNQDYLPRGT
jgi:hypothetical protein